ncbi:MAG: hypothetical protein GMKNLPBB_03262 [Myxococcota bacterium]|nr:hypothetical protein [Myxococcota bacterium]
MEIIQLDRNDTALLVIDFQERLANAMPSSVREQAEKNTRMLIEGFSHLGMPILVTEQYPKGLGPTVEGVAKALPAGIKASEKVVFNCCEVGEVSQKLAEARVRHVVLCGMETHICVFQTARGLLKRDMIPYVAADAVVSRLPHNREVGIDLMRRLGAVITSTETVLFDLVGRAGTAEFKFISNLVK